MGGVYVRDGTVGLLVGPEHANSMGTAHGGVLVTLADLALGLAVKQMVGPAVTVDLHARFLGPGAVGDWIEGRGQVDTSGQAVVHASCVLAAGGREILVAALAREQMFA